MAMNSWCAGAVFVAHLTAVAADAQRTRAERSNYTETSTHADVIAFIDSLSLRGARVHVGTMGRTALGRELPYVIASRPLITNPIEAKRLGRPIVYVQGNIRAGEVEGKEALQALLRDLLFDPRPNVLDSVVFIAVPDYNADGNDNMSPQLRNRGAQNGPELVGTRANSQGINLNRDYIRAEATETRASLLLFNTWDPDVFVDLHTTDGSYHGYALTYAPSLHPAAALARGAFGGGFARDSLLPEIRRRMRARHGYEIFDYGNFSGDEGPAADAGRPRSWVTYEHTPRYGVNYYALRGRISILSEAFSHDPFERRVKSTYAFVREILGLTAERSRSVQAITRGSDANLESGRSFAVPIRAVLTTRPSSQIVIEEILDTISEARAALRQSARGGSEGRGAGGSAAAGSRGGTQTPCPWPLSEPGMRCGLKRTGKFVNRAMTVFDRFEPTLTVQLPSAYLLRAGQGTDSLLAQLRLHGVSVERLLTGFRSDGEQFTIDSLLKLPPRDGHRDVRLEGKWAASDAIEGAKGDYIVRTSQPLGMLAAILLEPQSDDGLVTWDLFNAALENVMKGPDIAAHVFPVWRILGPFTAATRLLP